MNRKNRRINKGAALLLTVFMLLFFVLIARFGYLQIVQKADGKNLVALAKERWTNKQPVQAHRGSILDVNGKPLAKDVPAYTVVAVLSKVAPNYVKNPKETAAELSPILHMSKSRLLQLLTQNAFQVELGPGGRRMSYEQMLKVKKLHLPGIHFITQSKRYYPDQKFASYVLGFTDRDPKTDQLKGVMGVEKSMNSELSGKNGTLQYKSAPNGVQLPNSKDKKTPAKNGDNVYLTIDSHIQMFLDHAVTKANKKYHPKRIMAVVMDPKTGAILAMANRPSFNPNLRNIKNYTDQIISNPFEPGSVMKIFTLSAAVDAGVYNGHATYMSGSYKVTPNSPAIHDWNRYGWGRIDFNQAVQRSSNVGFAILAQKYIGFKRFYNYLQKFDFRKKTGIDLPNESNSQFRYKWPFDKATTAFGQGTAVTAMQLVKASTAVANNGKMMQPHIISKVVNPNTGKVVFKNKPQVAGTPISAASAKKVRQLLRMVVVGKYGTGKEFAIPGYAVTGKTGTAQIPSPKGGYMKNKYIHSFLGMAPEKNPQLIVYVAVDRPQVKTMFAGDIPVANIFKFTMEHSLQYLNVRPTQKQSGTNKAQSITIGSYQGKSVAAVKQQLEQKGLHVDVLGSGGTVVGQMPIQGEKVLPGSKILLKTNGSVKMPDLSGWSLNDVMKLAHLLDLQPQVDGTGFVSSQGIAPGTVLKKGQTLKVKLQAPHS